MIYKHMFLAYPKTKSIEIAEHKDIITHTLKYYEGKAFLYFESKNCNLCPEDFAKGDFIPYPDGKIWMEMAEIFHYFTPLNDDEWTRKIPNKEGVMRVNYLERDKISSYIYYHVEHQNDNQVDCDKFFSIYIYDNMIIIYNELPEELVTWDDIKGRNHHDDRYDWEALMDKHFKAWPDGSKGWHRI